MGRFLNKLIIDTPDYISQNTTCIMVTPSANRLKMDGWTMCFLQAPCCKYLSFMRSSRQIGYPEGDHCVWLAGVSKEPTNQTPSSVCDWICFSLHIVSACAYFVLQYCIPASVCVCMRAGGYTWKMWRKGGGGKDRDSEIIGKKNRIDNKKTKDSRE